MWAYITGAAIAVDASESRRAWQAAWGAASAAGTLRAGSCTSAKMPVFLGRDQPFQWQLQHHSSSLTRHSVPDRAQADDPAAAAGGTKKRRAVKLSGESRVFEEGSLGEAPGGGSISTYRELCSLATDMGQPDLVYRFMDLANHQASLNSSRGAAFG